VIPANDSTILSAEPGTIGFQQVAVVTYTQPLVFPNPTVRRIDYAGFRLGKWLKPTFVTLSPDAQSVALRFPVFQVSQIKRIRFGNPGDRYPTTEGGQWRIFHIPFPFNVTLPFPIPKLPAATLFLRRSPS